MYTICLSVFLFATAEGSPMGLVKPPAISSNTDIRIPWDVNNVNIARQPFLDSKANRGPPYLGIRYGQDLIEFDGSDERTGDVKIPSEQTNDTVSLDQTTLTSDMQVDISTEPSMEKLRKHKIPNRNNEKTPPKEKEAASSPSVQNSLTEKLNVTLRQLPPGLDYLFYHSANGSFKLHRTPAVWTDARLICYDEGAELVSPENDAILAAMSEILLTVRQPPLHVFTGVNDLYSKGFFVSLKGIPLSAMPSQWAPREPDNVNHGYNCLAMQRNGLLVDGKCDDMYPFICYKRQKTSQARLCGTTDTEYVFNRHTSSCHKVHTEDRSWQEAYATCAREGGYLAIMNSDYEAKTLGQIIKRWSHVGISYWRKDLWLTIHGQTLAEAGFETWAPGEPNDVNVERCGCLAHDVGTYVDIDCEYHALPFICEKSA